MRVKVGDQWFSVEEDQALMVELTDTDRRNIANMIPGARFYAQFDDRDPRDAEAKLAWMRAQ